MAYDRAQVLLRMVVVEVLGAMQGYIHLALGVSLLNLLYQHINQLMLLLESVYYRMTLGLVQYFFFAASITITLVLKEREWLRLHFRISLRCSR